MLCSLCNHSASFFGNFQNRNYNRCTNCASVFLDAKDLPSPVAEKNRYKKHENFLENSGYIEFLNPLVNAIIANHQKIEIGLDFGSGPNPILSLLLQKKGYNVQPYDLYFSKDAKALEIKYDYIICCEVIEHFHNPQEEFQNLYNLLKPGGILYCKTKLYDSHIDFENWWYKNDFTHCFFYSIKALNFIKNHFKFSNFTLDTSYFQFTK